MRKLVSIPILTALFAIVSPAAQEPIPVFKSGVEQVAVAATVRDSRGRLVTTLKAADFELIDQGKDVQLEKAKEILGQQMSKH